MRMCHIGFLTGYIVEETIEQLYCFNPDFQIDSDRREELTKLITDAVFSDKKLIQCLLGLEPETPEVIHALIEEMK